MYTPKSLYSDGYLKFKQLADAHKEVTTPYSENIIKACELLEETFDTLYHLSSNAAYCEGECITEDNRFDGNTAKEIADTMYNKLKEWK